MVAMKRCLLIPYSCVIADFANVCWTRAIWQGLACVTLTVSDNCSFNNAWFYAEKDKLWLKNVAGRGHVGCLLINCFILQEAVHSYAYATSLVYSVIVVVKFDLLIASLTSNRKFLHFICQ